MTHGNIQHGVRTMKIQTDQLSTLTQTSETTSDSKKATTDFASLLAQEVGGNTSATSGLSAPLLTGYAALDLTGSQETDTGATAASQAADGSNTSDTAAMDTMDSLLTEWDSYTDQLASGSGGDSLKKAYGILQNIETGVQQLKDGLTGSTNTDLNSMANELEVMATTEKIKFNRGDYA